MPKEYESIKDQYKQKHPDWSDEKVSEVASKVFYNVFGITVKEAIELEKQGEWVSWLKEHSKKEFNDSLECKTLFNYSDYEIKEKEDGFFVSGFVSAPVPDAKGELIDQALMVAKLNDPNNMLSKNLSYSHGWLKGDLNDHNPLGILQRAELKEHPKYKQPAAWAEYKLIKTHPYYNKAVYEIKEGALRGFSIEFKDSKKESKILGNVTVKKIIDYFLSGVAILGRPMHQDAILTGYEMKEFIFNGGENMEIKEDNSTPEVVVAKPVSQEPVNETKPDAVKESEKPKDAEKTDDKKTNDDHNAADELVALKKELEDLKQKTAEEARKKEIELIKQEIDGLKAKSKVLVSTDEQSFKTQIPTPVNDVSETINKIHADNSLTTEQKIKKLAEIQFSDLAK